MAQEETNVQHKPKHKLEFFFYFIFNNNKPRNEMRFIGNEKYIYEEAKKVRRREAS